MSSSSKFTFGIALLITGWLIFLSGIVLSFTGIGACIGIPMILLGTPLWIWGSVWLWQGKVRRAEEAISTGVREGIQQAAAMQAAVSKEQSSNSAPAVLPPQDLK